MKTLKVFAPLVVTLLLVGSMVYLGANRDKLVIARYMQEHPEGITLQGGVAIAPHILKSHWLEIRGDRVVLREPPPGPIGEDVEPGITVWRNVWDLVKDE